MGKRPIEEQVIVIVGASSGLGRQTALKLADRGARLVIASRSEPLLYELADELEARGAPSVLVVGCDVTDTEQVERLVESAVNRFGYVDTMMALPGLALLASVEQTDLDEYEQMLDVMMMGYVRLAKAILPVFRQQQTGALINVASVLGTEAVPYQSASVAAKHAVVGFTRTLQMELRDSHIDVSLVLPGAMATPLYTEHSRTTAERIPRAIPPVAHPKTVARKLVRCAERPRRTMRPDLQSKAIAPFEKLAPGLLHAFLSRFGGQLQLTDQPQPARRRDNFNVPSQIATRATDGTGGVLGRQAPTRQQVKSWVRSHPVKAAIGGVALLGALSLWAGGAVSWGR